MHTSILHFNNGQFSKAVRILKKAHKSAVALKDIHVWVKTLSMLARCYETPNYSGYQPEKAERIYQKLFRILDHHGMPIHKFHILMQYTEFLKSNHRISEALETSVKAGIICQNFGLEKAYDKVRKVIDELLIVAKT